MNGDAGERVSLWSLAPALFLPTIVYATGNGAVMPILALTALELGASSAVAGLVVALFGVGQLLGNVPAATLVNRLGDRRAMMVAAAVSAAAMLVSYFARHLVLLVAATFVYGMCSAAFNLARQSFVTLSVPVSVRAAAMSALGGSYRTGSFVGPLVGAALIHVTNLRGAYMVAIAAAAITGALLLFVPDPAPMGAATSRVRETVSPEAVWREHGRLLATLGLAIFAVGAVRGARSTVLPLWAAQIGLDAQTTSVLFGVGAAFEIALFYPAGQAMDRFGRLSVTIPSLVLLSGAMILLPLTDSLVGMALVTIVMSVGNGLGAGMVMTLGADVAPSDGPVRFLSQWRLMADAGNGCGPLLVASLAVWSLGAGIIAAGVLGLLATVGAIRWVPRYSAFATMAMVRNRARVGWRSDGP